MEKSPLWKDLKVLVEIDQRAQKFLSEISDIEDKIKEDKAVLPELEKSIAVLKQESLNAKKHVDLQELNAKHLGDQEKAKRKALESVKKQKEYAAMEKELSSLLQQLSEQDDALVQAWHNFEAAKQKETEETEKLNEKIELLKKDIEEKEAAIKTVKEKHAEVDKERGEKAATIPSEWLMRYERMKNRVLDPIVPVLNQSCSSCYYSIPPQDFTRLRRSAMLPCRSCYRFLYYNEEEEEDLSKTSF